jgi:hypothetical protein
MEKGTFITLAGLPMILAGIVGLKVTGLNLCWIPLAAGAIIACYGGITLSLKADALKGSAKPASKDA